MHNKIKMEFWIRICTPLKFNRTPRTILNNRTNKIITRINNNCNSCSNNHSSRINNKINNKINNRNK